MANAAVPFRIFTSYWANIQKVRAGDVIPVGISRFAPRFVTGVKTYIALAPDKELLNWAKSGSLNEGQFSKLFSARILDKLNPQEVFNDLRELGNGKDVAIVCYEKIPDWCHRHHVARWLRDSLGILIEEFPYKK